MARIPIVGPQVAPRGGLSVRRATAESFGALDTGLLEQNAARLGRHFVEQQRNDDAFEVSRLMAETKGNWLKRFQQATIDAPPGAAGFTDALMAEYQKEVDDIRVNAGLSAEAGQELEIKQLDFRNYLMGQAIGFEAQARGEQRKTQVQQSLTTFTQIVQADPAQYDTILSDYDAMIAALPLPADAREALRGEGLKELRLAASFGAALRDPAAMSSALTSAGGVVRGRLGGGSDYTPPATGNLPRGLRNNNPGNIKLTAATWEGEVAGNDGTFKVFATPEDGLREMGRLLAAYQTDHGLNTVAGIVGRWAPPSENDTDAYVAQVARALGVGSDAELDLRDPETLATLMAAMIQHENGQQPYSQAQLTSGASAALGDGAVIVQPETGTGQTGVPFLDDLPADERLRVLSFAETQVEKKRAESLALLAPKRKDAETAYLTVGHYDGPAMTEAEFLAAYGPIQGPQEWQAFQMTAQVGKDVERFRTMTDDEIAVLLAGAEPKNAGAGFDAAQSRYEVMQTAAKAVLDSRAKDPVAYVQANFPHVADAWSTASEDPDAVAFALSQTDQALKTIGITDGPLLPKAYVPLLPKAYVQSAVAAFSDASQGFSTRVDTIAGVVFATGDAEQQRRILDQLYQNGLATKYEGAFDAYARGDTVAAKRLFQAGMVKPEGTIDLTDAEVKAKIAEQVLAPGTIGDALYGLSGGVVGNATEAQRDMDLLTDAVKFELAAGRDIDQAVANATRDLYGDVAVYEGNGAIIAVPADAQLEDFEAGLEPAREIFRDAVESLVPAPGATDAERIAAADARELADMILDEGQLRNYGNGYALFDPTTRAYVAGPDGEPLVITYEQIVAAAAIAKATERQFVPFGGQ